MTKSDVSHKLLQLRVLVGFLGEKRQAGWWQSDFWSPTAEVFLSPVFPRTVFLSQAEGASAAARLVHDQRIGVGKVFHLFRLPENLEQSVHDGLQNLEVAQQLRPLLSDRQQAAEYLAKNFGKSTADNPIGPLLCGDISSIGANKTIAILANTYLSGFQRSVEVFPYFRESE